MTIRLMRDMFRYAREEWLTLLLGAAGGTVFALLVLQS